MKNALCYFLLSLTLFMTNCSGSKSATKEVIPKGIRFEKSDVLSDALDKAERNGKLVFVDLYTTWCIPCKVMDEEVFTDQNVIDVLNDNFISLKVDAEKGNGTNLAFLFQAQVYPTLLFLDQKGNIIERNNGSLSQTQLIDMASRALNTGGTW